MPDHDTAAPGHEDLGDEAASASPVRGEHEQGADWGDSIVQTECAAASNDLDTAAPVLEDLGDEGASASAVLGEHEQGAEWGDSNVQTECATKPFPGFPRSVVYDIGRYLGTELIRTNPGIAYRLVQLVDFSAEDQQGPGPGPGASATASGQASRSETRGLVLGPARASGRASTCPFRPFTE